MSDVHEDRRSAALVIAVHGASVNGRTWDPLRRLLARCRVEMIAPDLPGHGAHVTDEFTIAGAVGIIEDAIAANSGRSIVLVGDSLGGYLALLVAARNPGALAGTVAAGCGYSFIGPGARLAELSEVPVRFLARLVGWSWVERAMAAVLRRVVEGEDADAIVAAGLRAAARGESLVELRGLDLTPVVRRIRSPLVFVHGWYDWPTRADAAMLALRAGCGRSITVAGHGHGIGLLGPAAIASAVLGVLESAPSRPPQRKASEG